jgi:hypothetical protein
MIRHRDYFFICGVSKRLNEFILMKGGWFRFENHPDWVKQFYKEFFTIESGLLRKAAVKMYLGEDQLLYEEIRTHGIRTPPRHFKLYRRGHVQKFKPVKNIPIPKNSQ